MVHVKLPGTVKSMFALFVCQPTLQFRTSLLCLTFNHFSILVDVPIERRCPEVDVCLRSVNVARVRPVVPSQRKALSVLESQAEILALARRYVPKQLLDGLGPYWK
jgi:hypothetical protein